MTRLLFGISLLALGCASSSGDGEPACCASSGAAGTGASGGATGAGGTGASSGAAGSGATGERPYANVVAVAATGDPSAYSFAVTVESADIDCSQYADWWEVVSADESLAYRRILEHSHTDANGTTDADAPGNTFTRSGGPVDALADDVLVVRAHMNNAGYNGMALRGSVTGGFVEAPDIDSTFAAGVEDDEPLPAGCQF